jgi:hypothetical protein
VLVHDKSLFKGHLKDDWVHPVAHFEMAANLWMERPTYQELHGPVTRDQELSDKDSADVEDSKKQPNERQLVKECKTYLDQAAKWESYELDARIGLKVTAAMEAVHKWENMHPVSE